VDVLSKLPKKKRKKRRTREEERGKKNEERKINVNFQFDVQKESLNRKYTRNNFTLYHHYYQIVNLESRTILHGIDLVSSLIIQLIENEKRKNQKG